MARDTTRDQIWNETLTILDETDIDEWFRPSKVKMRLGGGVSDRTLRDTLNTMWEMGYLDRRGGNGPVRARYGHPYGSDDADDQADDDRVDADHAGAQVDGSASIYWCRFCETATLAEERPDSCGSCSVEGSGLDDLGLVAEADSDMERVTVCWECETVMAGLTSYCASCGNEAIHQAEPRSTAD